VPASEVVTVWIALVSVCLMVTVAPATSAPVASVTVPVIEPVVPCPRQTVAMASRSTTAIDAPRSKLVPVH
jgi:hypothetical protein